jgi:RNA polymerase sigma-70 factor (ECF subfamily)
MKDTDFSILIQRIKASDETGFETLFNFFQAPIFNFLLFKVKDPAIAEDLLQETFLKIWKTRAALDENRSIKNYLYTIADNLALNHFRHAKVVSNYKERRDAKIFSLGDSPEFILEEKEWQISLAKAIEALPEKTRVVFLMSRMEDLTYEEIASRLQISIKTVESHMTKALKLLREDLRLKL